jgi:hypothetical protein
MLNVFGHISTFWEIIKKKVTGVERESPSVSRTAQRFVMAQKVFGKY